MMKRATMIEVARLANVGTMTVSRVLNKSAHVHPKTASRVHEAIARLGYRPNDFARALRGAKSRTIGLIVPSLADPFFAICAHNVNTVAQAQGYAMILASSNDSVDTEFAQAEWMLQKQVDGLIVCPVTVASASRLADPLFERTPMVAFDCPLALPRVDSVVVENHAGAKAGTRHLIEHGHRQIHFLGDSPERTSIRMRHEGYRRALSTAGLPSNASLHCNSEEAVFEYLQQALARPEPPTALFAGNNRVSRYIYRTLHRLARRIPEDIAVIGFDDFDMADMLQPALTVIAQPVSAMGRTAASVLFKKLTLPLERWPEEGERTMLKVDLRLRTSCGCLGGVENPPPGCSL